MKNIATICSRCHAVPTWAENHTIVPNPKTSERTTLVRLETPMFPIAIDMSATFVAPRTMVAHDCSNPVPKIATTGVSRTAGPGGYGTSYRPFFPTTTSLSDEYAAERPSFPWRNASDNGTK